MKNRIKIFTFACLFIFLGLTLSCGKLPEGQQAAPQEVSAEVLHGEKKWNEFSEALRLPEEIDSPSGYFTKPELQKEYLQLVLDSAKRFNHSAYRQRCAAIKGFTNMGVQAKGHHGEEFPVDVYHMQYQLQKNFDGDAEAGVRHALVTVPKTDGAYPLLAFAHGGDEGLSYSMIARNVGDLQKDHIVIAPTFPGEAFHDSKDAEIFGVRNPWINDVDDLLGAHDCVARFVHHQSLSEAFPYDAALLDLIAELDSEIDLDVKEELNQALQNKSASSDNKVKVASYQNYFNFYPKSLMLGASRGGLVASLALAKAGAILYELKKAPEVFALMFGRMRNNFVFRLLGIGGFKTDVAQYFSKTLGRKYGLLPPAFQGITTVSAPATVMVGSLRVILKEMVMGNVEKTRAKELPGLKHLGHIFDKFRNGEQDVEEAKKEVIDRDFTLLSPLVIAALRDWSAPLNSGSFMFIHGKQDKVVPYHQTLAAYNILFSQAENEKVRSMTLTPYGLNISVRVFDLEAEHKVPQNRETDVSFHFDDAFYHSKSLLPYDFISDYSLQSFYKQLEMDLPASVPVTSEHVKKLKMNELHTQARILNELPHIDYFANTFTEDALMPYFEMAPELNEKDFAKEVHSNKHLSLLSRFHLSNGIPRSMRLTPGLVMPTLDYSKLSIVERTNKAGEAFLTFFDELRPTEVLRSWADQQAMISRAR